MSVERTIYSVKIDKERVPLFDEDFYQGFRSEMTVHFTMAALDPAVKSNDPVTVKVITRLQHSDDEDEEDEEKDDEEEQFVLCTLKKGAIYQQPINLTFSPGEEVFFEKAGDATVYLSGSCTVTNVPEDSEDSDMDDDESGDDEDFIFNDDGLSEDEDFDFAASENEDEDESEDGGARIEELGSDEEQQEDEQKQGSKLESPQKKEKHTQEKEEEVESKKRPSEETPDTEEKEKKQKSEKPAKTYAKKTLEGNVVVQDKVIGNGPAAKKGKRVSMRYIGRLKNGKVFDKNINGKPFVFNLGLEEVIRGWDIGVAGMQVGGERTLHIPSLMAYGAKRLPGIPANSDLIFDVKLLAVN
ncbi:FKBP-type peptidyl-prolyl cis-trans isomerase [Schizosaccharomyces cryophilus OY26]|uniref:peptidylprolyl isomerase n=1 Tax=Schizosaccharomyces cryophilus (strain OY26 / ATCC MYA-4695 / CBS 11777 / NBRC 106824 / NRRL Y48691) TaxID=653667 RepID=S9W1R5_SCHCR|nr:FKBP-type peptidyl-prolyl cis-trans isomerase [Schizosaccharomyces cryophilus OY26]EPY51960.1 FKBP-type peptidyl-prolyl cis-trans isomerase [Schizosaccharomyces cryophilus OY26]